MKVMVNVDAAGRLVLPKKVRDALGVRGPMRLAVDVVEHFGPRAWDAPSQPLKSAVLAKVNSAIANREGQPSRRRSPRNPL